MERFNVVETPKDERKPFLLRLPPELHLALKRYALEEDRTLGSILLEWIQDGWKRVPGHEQYERAPGATRSAAETASDTPE